MSPQSRAVHTDDAPAAIGPYVQAVASGDLVFCSGQVGIDPGTGKLVSGGVEAQAERSLANLMAVLAAGGCGPGDVLKTTVYLRTMNDFAAVNSIYAATFGAHKPARATVAVADLPLGALVEVDAVARVPARS